MMQCDSTHNKIYIVVQKFAEEIEQFLRKAERELSGALTRYVPRHGVFNSNHYIAPERLVINSKPFKHYFKPYFYRRCFMVLKTFRNLRF